MVAKKLYDELLRTGDLFEMFEGLVGDWKEDKKSFIKQQKDLENVVKSFDINE